MSSEEHLIGRALTLLEEGASYSDYIKDKTIRMNAEQLGWNDELNMERVWRMANYVMSMKFFDVDYVYSLEDTIADLEKQLDYGK